MLKYPFFIIALLVFSIPGVFADLTTSTINDPDQGFTFSGNPTRTNDVAFSEDLLQKWHDILKIETTNIQPIFFLVIVMIIFVVSLATAIASKATAISGMFFILSFVMALILVLIFLGNLEFGIIQEETTSSVNTNTGIFEITKTYHTNKLIPNDTTFRPIFSLVFQILLFFSMIMFVVKLFIMPILEKRKSSTHD